MIELIGKYTSAKIFTDNVESDAQRQILNLCNHPLFTGKKIRVMPDVHVGKASVIGLACEIDTEHIIPQLLGVDLYCTISAFEITGREKDYAKLDKVIKNLKIKEPKHVADIVARLCDKHNLNPQKYKSMFGGIGKGNHFISVEESESGKRFLIIHSGSRGLGYDVAIKYSDLAYKENPYTHSGELKQLAWLSSESSKEYLSDLKEFGEWVFYNQSYIAENICKEMKWKLFDTISCPHNYIDTKGILHKGSIKMSYTNYGIVPINMADGSFIIKAWQSVKYDDWLFSAPHGAGRLYKRSDCNNLDMKEYKNRMKNVFSSNVNVNTIDESPMAYKPIEEIRNAIEPQYDIVSHLKPVYNYKE